MAKKTKYREQKETHKPKGVNHESLVEKLLEAQEIAEQLKLKIRTGDVVSHRTTIIKSSAVLHNLLRSFK